MWDNNDTIQIDLNELKYRFQHELSYFNDYVDFNEDKLSSRRLHLDNLLKLDIQENPDNESFLRSIYYLDYIKIPSYFYHSVLVSLYSLLESNLDCICEKIQKDTDLVVGLNDFSGSNLIQKARKYLIKFADIDFDLLEKEWLRISDFQKLRNLIVHGNSRYSSDGNKEIEEIKLLMKFAEIQLEKNDSSFYIKTNILAIEFLKLINTFILSICNQIESKDFKKFDIVRRRYELNYLDKEDEFPDLPF